MAVRMLEWVWEATGESYGEVPDLVSFDQSPVCPFCECETHYWEGDIDQDEQGNYIRGSKFVCFECGIGVKVEVID